MPKAPVIGGGRPGGPVALSPPAQIASRRGAACCGAWACLSYGQACRLPLLWGGIAPPPQPQHLRRAVTRFAKRRANHVPALWVRPGMPLATGSNRHAWPPIGLERDGPKPSRSSPQHPFLLVAVPASARRVAQLQRVTWLLLPLFCRAGYGRPGVRPLPVPLHPGAHTAHPPNPPPTVLFLTTLPPIGRQGQHKALTLGLL